jgi:hypothetical protein
MVEDIVPSGSEDGVWATTPGADGNGGGPAQGAGELGEGGR